MAYSLTIAKIVERLESRNPLPPLTPKKEWDSELSQRIKNARPEELFDGQSIKNVVYAAAVQSGLLLWNDALTTSHTISQQLQNKTGSYWHGVMHRREPDYSNAKYWFGRVGDHPVFPILRKRALELLETASDESPLLAYARALQGKENWDAFQFVDWCQAAEGNASTPEAVRKFLETLQLEEIKLLLDYSYQQALA